MSNNLFLFLKAEKKKKIPTLWQPPLLLLLLAPPTALLMGPELQHEKALHAVNCKNLINEDE